MLEPLELEIWRFSLEGELYLFLYMFLGLLTAVFVQMGEHNILIIFCNFKSGPSVEQIELEVDIDGTETHACSSLSA